MLHLFDLCNDIFETLQETLGVVIVKDVQVNTLTAACEECFVISFSLNASSDRSKYECPRIYCLQVPSGHLQHNRVGCGNNGNDLRASLNTSASLVLLRLICGYFEIYKTLAQTGNLPPPLSLPSALARWTNFSRCWVVVKTRCAEVTTKDVQLRASIRSLANRAPLLVNPKANVCKD